MKNSNKKEEIIEAVTLLFSEKGYMTAMSDIASVVKIKVPSLYSHFTSKDEIIYIVVKKEINNYYDSLLAIQESLVGKSSKEALEKSYFYIFDYFDTKEKIKFWHNIYLIQNEELMEKCKKLIIYRNISNINNVKKIFKKGISEKEIINSNFESEYLYLSMIQGVLEGILLYGDVARPYALKIWEAFWNGIKIE